MNEGTCFMRVTVNGVSINYVLEGRAGLPVVTLSHSLATSLEMWRPPQASPHFCTWEVCLLDPGALNISATEATM
jgi:hypothetical protein